MSLESTPAVITVTPSTITLTSFDKFYRTDAAAFPLGISQAELTSWFADISSEYFIGYDDEWNDYALMPSAWFLEGVDTNTKGVYYASAVPELGADYVLADGVALPRQLFAVSIQKPGEPDINCIVSARGFVRFPWVLSEEQQEQLDISDAFAVWLRKDAEEWKKLDEGFWLNAQELGLSQRMFAFGSTYALKVTYRGGQTGVLTFEYDGELSILDYSIGDRDGGDVVGNNGGSGSQPPPTSPTLTDDSNTPDSSSDSNGSNESISPNTNNRPPVQNNSSPSLNETPAELVPTLEASVAEPMGVFNERLPELLPVSINPHESEDFLPDKVQPAQTSTADNSGSIPRTTQIEAPPTPSSPSASHKTENASATPNRQSTVITEPKDSSSALESYSPEQTVISGLRLRDLCQDESSVVFGSGGLTVSIPSKLLLALNLSDTDPLSVRLAHLKNNQIMLSVDAAGKAVTELSGTILRLRYNLQPENTEITILNEVGEQITDATFDGEVLRFSANTAGIYSILEVSKAPAVAKNTFPLLPVLGGLIPVLGVGGILFFRWKYHG